MLQEHNRNSILINIQNKQTSGCYFCTLIIWSNLGIAMIQIHVDLLPALRVITGYRESKV